MNPFRFWKLVPCPGAAFVGAAPCPLAADVVGPAAAAGLSPDTSVRGRTKARPSDPTSALLNLEYRMSISPHRKRRVVLEVLAPGGRSPDARRSAGHPGGGVALDEPALQQQEGDQHGDDHDQSTGADECVVLCVARLEREERGGDGHLVAALDEGHREHELVVGL